MNIFLASLLAFPICFGGCTKEEPIQLFRTADGSEIGLYETVNLYISERCEVDSIIWTSSNESVLSVENGRLVAHSIGEADITAEWNGIKQTETYTVSASQESWNLEIRDTLALVKGQTFALTPQLKTVECIFDEAAFTYSVSNPNIATLTQDGVITAVNKGQMDILVSAYVDGEMVDSKTVLCSIVDNVGIYPAKNEYTVYLIDEIRGCIFEKEIPLTAVVYCDGVIVENASVEWTVSDESVVDLKSGNILSAKKVGTTHIVGSCTVNGEEYKTQPISVNVEIPLLDLKDDVIVDLSKTEQILDSYALFGEGYSIGSIYDITKNKTITVTNNAVRTATLKSGESTCIIYNTEKTVGAIVNLVAADFVVYDFEDLKEIASAEHANHYIALANDIEVNGSYKALQSGVDFSGTFNGLGHTLFGMKFDKYGSGGLFFSLIGATVKNLSFIDAEISNWNNALIAYANSYQTCLIDNIYAEVTFKGDNISFAAGLVSFGHVGQITIKNTVLRVNGLDDEKRGAENGLAVGRLYYCRAALENFYVVGQGSLCGQKANAYNTNYASINRNVSCIYATDEQFEKERTKEGSKIDESGFNHYWDIEGEKLCFKTNKRV